MIEYISSSLSTLLLIVLLWFGGSLVGRWRGGDQSTGGNGLISLAMKLVAVLIGAGWVMGLFGLA